MKIGKVLRKRLSYCYKCLRTKHKLGRIKMLAIYLKFIFLQTFGGIKQTTIGKIKVNTPNFPHFIHLFEDLFIDRCYHTDLKAAPRILDLGGNMGMASIYFKTLYPQARIDAFEASLETAALLKSNLTANGWTDCQGHHLAVADHDGELTFFNKKAEVSSGYNSAFVERMGSDEFASHQVPCKRLSSLIDGPIDLLKVDIEGAEMSVFKELDASGKMGLIDQMFIEYHHHLKKNDDALSEFLGLLEKNNFGYVLTTWLQFPTWKNRYQDVVIYAYKKEALALGGG